MNKEMNEAKLVSELDQTRKLLAQLENKFKAKNTKISVKKLLLFYYHTDQLNHDNPGLLAKLSILVSDHSVHILLFIFGVIYPLSIMSGNLIRSFKHSISLGMISKYIVFDVTSNIFIYILLLVMYMLIILFLCHHFRKHQIKDQQRTKRINRFQRTIYNLVLLYIINMFTIYATLIGTIFTISSSISQYKMVLIIAFFFSLIIIPVLSISLFVSTVNKINDLRG